MLSFRMAQGNRTIAVDMSYRTAAIIHRELAASMANSVEFGAVIIPFGERYLVGTQDKKTGLIRSYVIEYEIGHDLKA